jgi:hypothetical protein
VVNRDWYRTATTAPTLEERIAALAAGSAQLMAAAADVTAVARLMRETLQVTPDGYEKWLVATWRRIAAAATRN